MDEEAEKAPGKNNALRVGGIDRKDFLKRAGLLVAGLLLAGSVGGLAGCGTGSGETVATQSRTRVQNTAPGSADREQPGEATNRAGDVQCPFYRNGICTRSNTECTDCRGEDF